MVSGGLWVGVHREDQSPPVLFFPTPTLPGWITWKPFIDVLGKSRSVLTFELEATRLGFLGHTVPENYSLRRETQLLADSLAKSPVEGPLDLVGHSAGAQLALDFALDHADRVRSLILIEPACGWVRLDCMARSSEESKRGSTCAWAT